MSLITWNFDKNFIFVIIYWVLEIILRIGIYMKPDVFKMAKDYVHNEYIIVMLNIISDLFAGFLVLYIKCASKSKKINNKALKTQSQSELIYTKLDKLKKNFYIKFIIIVVLDYISRSRAWISYAITKAISEEIFHSFKNNIKITLDIIMRYIFSIFILKIIVYKHRIFSMITIGIGFALLIINDILLMFYGSDKYDIGKTLIFTGISSIIGLTYPLEDTFVKQIFLEDYLNPAKFQFYRGIAESILIAVITPILFFSFQIKLDLGYYNLNIVIPTIIIRLLANFFKSYITLKIIYHYSSQSVSFLLISQSFGGSITRLIEIFIKGIGEEWKIIFILLEIISILIILFASLVYDEIIIINKWRFNENVKLGIINRGEIEMEVINTFRDSKLDDNQLVDNDINEIYSEDNEHNEYNENNVDKE